MLKPIELRVNKFLVQTFGHFPISETMKLKDYLRAALGRGDYKIHPAFETLYPELRQGTVVHLNLVHPLSNGALWDYFFVGHTLSSAYRLAEDFMRKLDEATDAI